MPKKKWDKGADYEMIKQRLLALLKETRLRVKLGSKRARRRLTHILILLIQLRNGSRIGEAIEALYRFAETKATEVYVRLEKQKEYDERLMVLPDEIKLSDLDNIVHGVTRQAVNNFAIRHLGVNTHSLRYAFVTYWSQKGYSPSVIAKFTGHKNLNHLLTYTQKKKAEELLRQLPF